jgi:hypothetical protein
MLTDEHTKQFFLKLRKDSKPKTNGNKNMYLSFPDHYTASYDYAIQGYSPLPQLCCITSALKIPINTQQCKVMVSASVFLAFHFVLFLIYL